jgi:hypothetical protein
MHRKGGVHDIAFTNGLGPRLHHVAFWVPTPLNFIDLLPSGRTLRARRRTAVLAAKVPLAEAFEAGADVGRPLGLPLRPLGNQPGFALRFNGDDAVVATSSRRDGPSLGQQSSGLLTRAP